MFYIFCHWFLPISSHDILIQSVDSKILMYRYSTLRIHKKGHLTRAIIFRAQREHSMIFTHRLSVTDALTINNQINLSAKLKRK